MKNIEELNLKDKKYIIFDLDGTLIDSIGIWNDVDNILIKRYANIDINKSTIQDERDTFLNNNPNGNTYLNYSQYLIERYKIKGISKDELTEERIKIFRDVSLEISFKPDVANLIKRLKELRFILILATMSGTSQIQQYSSLNTNMIKEMNLLEEFNLIITKDDVINKKPHPEIYFKAMEHYNAKPHECLIFEDSYTGVISAKNANIDVINIYDKYADIDRNLIDELTTYKINSYKEFIEYINNLYNNKSKTLKI